MEFVFELLFEIIITGMLDASGSRKIPVFIRLLIVTVLFGTFITVGIWGTLCFLNDRNTVTAVIFSVLTLAAIFLWLLLCYLIIKKRYPKSR